MPNRLARNPSTASLMPAATKRRKATRISPAVIAQTTTGTSKMRARVTRFGMLNLRPQLGRRFVDSRCSRPCDRQYSRDQPVAQLSIPEYRGAPLSRARQCQTRAPGTGFADRFACERGESRRPGERMAKKRIAVLISGRGSNLLALIQAAKQPDYPAEISLVLSDRAEATGLSHARAAGIETAIVDHATHRNDRQAFEQMIQKLLVERDIEFDCLAGFMRLLTPWFVSRWDGRLINIHPALLPAFKGLDTHRRALAAGVKIHGASVHFVVAEMDSGPIIAQGAIAVREEDDAETLAARVLEIEHRIYPIALGLVAAGRVRITGGRCVIEGAASVGQALIVPDAQGAGNTTQHR